MGEYAEMMLDGTCCACCGDYLGTDAGFPIYCAACAPDFDQQPFTGLPIERKRKARGPSGKPKPCVCGDCGKSFHSKGARRNHRRHKHPAKPAANPSAGVEQ
jgi:hypothetical protein